MYKEIGNKLEDLESRCSIVEDMLNKKSYSGTMRQNNSTNMQRVRVDEKRGVVSITDFSMSDREVVEYFASQDPGLYEDRLEVAIRTGVLALKSTYVGERVDYVKKEFERLKTDLEKQMNETVRGIDGYLGNDGTMPRLMKAYVGEEGEVFKVMERYIGEGGEVSGMAKKMAEEWADTLRQSMDPRNEQSPLHYMHQDILDRLNTMVKGIGGKDIEQKTPLKGQKFEEYCRSELGELTHVIGDTLEDTSKTTGSVANSKKGDLVATVAGTDARIVIEVKNVTEMSEREASDVLDDSMENRGADFGLLVMKNVEAFSKSMGRFHEFNSTNKLAVALGSKSDDDNIIHREILLIAYKWARARVAANSLETGTVDAKAMAEKMKKVKDSLSKLSYIKGKATTIKNTADDIHRTAGQMTDDINTALDDVHESLGI